MISLKRTNSVKSIIENLEIFRMEHNKGVEEFNNRKFDPFHIFATDYNQNGICRILEKDRERYFPKPECYVCSGNIEPRPMSCYRGHNCHYFPHKRGSKEKPEGSPLMEIKITSFSSDLSIYLSRCNLSWLLDHQEYDFIVRTTYVNNWVLHHSNIDGYDDSPGNIKIVNGTWHLNTHRELKDRNNKITKLESMFLLKNDRTILKELEVQRYLRSMVIDRLTKIQDDPDILRCLIEVGSKIN